MNIFDSTQPGTSALLQYIILCASNIFQQLICTKESLSN